MTQEDRLLVLRDLCVRLPYNPYCLVKDDSKPRKLIRIEVDEWDGILLDFATETYESLQVYLSEVKPCLRPISSMTEDEVKELAKIKHGRFSHHTILDINDILLLGKSEWSAWVKYELTDKVYITPRIYTTCEIVGRVNWETTRQEIDWLDAHYFDYTGLIDKGLAIEVTKDNNPYK